MDGGYVVDRWARDRTQERTVLVSDGLKSNQKLPEGSRLSSGCS